MSHRAHSKGKIWSSSMNLKGKQRELEEEEVDELESESETTAFESTTPIQHQHPHSERVLSLDVHPQWETISSTTSSSKVGGKKTAKAHVQDKPAAKDNPHIPFARMESILHNDHSGTLSKEAIHLVLCATEHFIRRLSKTAHTRSKVEGRAITTYKDVADTAHYFEEFNFLEGMSFNPLWYKSASDSELDMIPRPMSVKLAMAERAKKVELSGVAPEGGNAEEKPSIAYIPEPSASASTAKGKGKAKAPAANGRSSSSKQLNGHASAYADYHGDESVSSSLPRQKSKKARVSAVNGATAPTRSRSSTEVSRSASSGANGSSGGMKIKIRYRSSVAAPERTPDANGTLNGVLPLGPPSHYKANGNSSKNADGHMFAPPGVADAPLWTRVPLPPPPSPRTRSSGAPSTNGSQQGSHSNHASGAGVDYRGALLPNASNPGRTIYSQR